MDGKEKYNSGVMTIATPVQPMVVDIAGGKLLELMTEEAGAGLYGDYSFRGEASVAFHADVYLFVSYRPGSAGFTPAIAGINPALPQKIHARK